MADKRNGRASAITGVGDETASALTPEQLALMGYQIPTTRHLVVDALPDGAIIPQDDGTWAAGNVQLTSTGIIVNGDVTGDQWLSIGTFLKKMEGSLQWMIGDWVNGCHDLWPDTYERVVEQTGFRYNTVKNLAYITRNVPPSVRTDKLKIGTYMVIAPLHLDDGSPDVERQLYWVNRAINERLSKSALRAAMQQPTPLSSGVDGPQVQKVLISREKPREFRQFLKLASKAGRGDVKAKQRALGQIVQYRQWLDDMEAWLKG